MLAIITKMTLTQVISRCRRMRVGFELVSNPRHGFEKRSHKLVCQSQRGEVRQLFEPLVKTFVHSPQPSLAPFICHHYVISRRLLS